MPMLLRNTTLRPLLLCLACLLPQGSAEAGVIPWTYNAVFGYGPVFPNRPWGAPYAPYGGYAGYGYGWGGGYPVAGYYGGMGYDASPYAVSYGGAYPGYGTYPTVGACSSCNSISANYGPACNSCGGCETGCSNCSGTSTYSPQPESDSDVQPTPAQGPKQPPRDDFERTTPRNNDDSVRPQGGSDAPQFERPMPSTPPVDRGEEDVFPLGGGGPASNPNPPVGRTIAPMNGEIAPTGGDVNPGGGPTPPAEANPFNFNRYQNDQLQPLDLEPAVASTTAPTRRRTGFTTTYRVPTAVRVALTPGARQPSTVQVATKK